MVTRKESDSGCEENGGADQDEGLQHTALT
jgi:hypothetical protein